jgi:DnaJ-domain-containing protein 1
VGETPNLRKRLSRGELVRLLYRIGRHGASGLLTIATDSTKGEVFVLRRGSIVMGDGDAARKSVVARLARLVAVDEVIVVFETNVAAYPPGATHSLSLAGWARAHLEAQLDGALADVMVRELAGVRLLVKPELAPEPTDDADRRMLLAMSQPRRLDQIWPLARTPRFRLLAFLHFLRTVDALDGLGVVAERSAPHRSSDWRRANARKVLGVEPHAELDVVKRAYRKLARELHPDLQPLLDEARKRVLERKFAEVTAAYELLL